MQVCHPCFGLYGPQTGRQISYPRSIGGLPHSQKFLETILLELKHAGMLGSKAGKGGGYYLRRKPGEINLAEVVRLFDGAIAAVPCATYKFYEPCKECEDETTCSIRHAFLQVRNATVEMLKRDTLEALVEKEQLLTRRKK